MRVVVGCEFSGRVRDAFLSCGHEAISVDLLPSESVGPHYLGDLRDFDFSNYDLAILHPPCTHLAVSGARWFEDKVEEQIKALEFFQFCLNVPVPRLCVENPVSIVSSKLCRPNQKIQPFEFGHGETKTTCLWLKGLPNLQPTNVVLGREAKVHHEPPSINRWKNRSRTYEGIAKAMAAQWGILTPCCICGSKSATLTREKGLICNPCGLIEFKLRKN